jgi:hypothetical protein
MCGAALAQGDQISNPRGVVTNFDPANIGPVLTEIGAIWEQGLTNDGRKFLVVGVGDGLFLQLIPSACQGQNNTECLGLLTVMFFEGQDINYQTVAAFNQKYPFSTAGIPADNSGAYVSRYDIADYGIARGNVVSSLQNTLAIARIFAEELSTGGKTVSLEGYAEDMSSRLLNRRGVEALSGPGAVSRAEIHQRAFEEATELTLQLIKDKSVPRNKISNVTSKK